MSKRNLDVCVDMVVTEIELKVPGLTWQQTTDVCKAVKLAITNYANDAVRAELDRNTWLHIAKIGLLWVLVSFAGYWWGRFNG